MQPTPTFPALSATLVVLALVAHLWMLEAPGVVDTAAAIDVATVTQSSPPTLMAGCTSGMGACRVPMPGETPLLLVALVLLGFAGRSLGRGPHPAGVATGVTAPGAERAPPRPCVPESVVLLV